MRLKVQFHTRRFINSTDSARLNALRRKLQESTNNDLALDVDSCGSLPGSGRLPTWLKSPIPIGKKFGELKASLRQLNLHTVQMVNAESKYI